MAAVLDESWQKCESRQAQVTVRRHSDAAIDQVQEDGFVVTRREAEANAGQR
ncbi:MAG TPA: hypothetical protein VIL48_17380 [Acidimicrobiales bacterium]